MSTLEERRAERRRRRQMDEESLGAETKSADQVHAEVQERLARRRREREERLVAMASSVATVNGEDDLERRRRERRETRLRTSGDTDSASTDDFSYRRNRRRGTDDDITEDTPTVNDTSSVPDTSEVDSAAERRRRQQQEDEEEARRQQQREEEEEERQRQEAERRKEAEEARRRQEAERERERQRLEEEERRRQEFRDAGPDSDSQESYEEDQKEIEDDNRLFIDERELDVKDSSKNAKGDTKLTESTKVDKFEQTRKWNEDSNSSSDREQKWNKFETVIGSTEGAGDKSYISVASVKEVNNNKILDRLSKFENLKDESDASAKKPRDIAMLVAVPDGLKGKLQKFEQEIKEQENQAKDGAGANKGKKEMYTPKPHKLSKKLQQFETAARTSARASKSATKDVQFELSKIGSARGRRKALLGRWSASETQINRTESRESTPQRNVLERWKSTDKQSQEPETIKSPTEKKESLQKRLSGNTEFIASKYIGKASKGVDESLTLPKSPEPTMREPFIRSDSQRNETVQRASQFFEHQAEISQEVRGGQSKEPLGLEEVNARLAKAKIADRWPFKDGNRESLEENKVNQSKMVTSKDQPRVKVTDRWSFKGTDQGRSVGQMTNGTNLHSRESSYDQSSVHSSESSFDKSSDSSRRRASLQRQEEEEAELERQRQEEEQARMAETEPKKKRGKRKGLGGLTPEKKKKLKQIIMQKAAEDLKKEALAKAKEKEKFINERVGPLNIDGLGEDELRRFIKNLQDKLAQIHSEAYDIEFKLFKQDKEVADLTMKINDSRGKFAKPVLRKVNKTEQKFAAISTKKTDHSSDFRETLKSAHDDDEN
ncbi:trichohyalin-like isoform X2 [Mya arenaria]|uniref:trichohyalin-like isoform X2 n=1 Tax=Mya arenaria TaxID=6604 RepID=UPI0022E8964E|nr:trichohyalin-like isoform X2 [Mya arenaria]